MPHILTIIGIVLGWGDFFFPYKSNKGSTKKIITGCMEMKTLPLFISSSEREEDKAFNFQAFKVIVSLTNTSHKTNVFKTASVMVSGGKKKGHEKVEEMKESRENKMIIFSQWLFFPDSAPCSAHM